MGLVACKCPQCGADLEFDESRDMMFCQYCGSKILKTNVIQNVTNNITNNIQADNVNVSGRLDADTMFENWLITRRVELEKDFDYYYATETEKRDYIRTWHSVKGSYDYSKNGMEYNEDITSKKIEETKQFKKLAKRLSFSPRFAPHLSKDIEMANEFISKCEEHISKVIQRKKDALEAQRKREEAERLENERQDRITTIKAVSIAVLIVAFIVFCAVFMDL